MCFGTANFTFHSALYCHDFVTYPRSSQTRPRLQLTEIFFMESDNGGTYRIDLIFRAMAYSVLEAVGDNGVTKRFYHRLTPVPANVTARKMHSTGFGSGIAVPHGKSACVKQPFVLFARKTQAIDWQTSDGEDVNCWICLGVPQSGEEDQVKIIGTVSQNYPSGFYPPTATRRHQPGACFVKSNPQLIRT